MDHLARYREDNKYRLMLESENLDLIEELLKSGVSPHQMSAEKGKSPIIEASAGKTKLLLQYGANVNEKDKTGVTALNFAGAEKTDILLSAGALFNQNKGVNILLSTLNNRSLSAKEKIEKIKVMQKFGYDLRATFMNKKNALFYASEIEVVDFLINEDVDYKLVNDAGENVLYQENISSQLIYHYAKMGILINHKNKEGISPVCYHTHVSTIKALIDCGADLDGFYFDLKRPHPLLNKAKLLSMSKKDNANEELINIYKTKNFNFTQLKDEQCRTPLFFAETPKALKMLVECGVNVNAKNKKGETAIIFHAENIEMIIALIHAGADVNVVNKNGEPLIHLVKAKSIPALLKAGCDIHTLNKNNENALFKLKNTTQDFKKLKKLLANNLDIYQVSSRTQLTALESLPENFADYIKSEIAKKEKKELGKTTVLTPQQLKNNSRL